MAETEILYREDGAGTYECGPDACNYDGETYCANCGYPAVSR